MDAKQLRFALSGFGVEDKLTGIWLDMNGAESINLAEPRFESYEMHDDVGLLEVNVGEFRDEYIGSFGENLWVDVHTRGSRFIPYERITEIMVCREPLKLGEPYEK